MKLSTSAFCAVTLTALVLFFALPLSSNALAQDHTMDFDSVTQSIVWTVSNGDAVYYFVHPEGSGCIESAVELDSLLGPNGTSSFQLNCVGGPGNLRGLLESPICEEENCFYNYEIGFKCGPECIIKQRDEYIPSISEWGMLVLLTLLVITGAYLIRRKRATAVR